MTAKGVPRSQKPDLEPPALWSVQSVRMALVLDTEKALTMADAELEEELDTVCVP